MPRTFRTGPDVRPGWAGFGLIGLLIVVAIVLYLMFGVGGGGVAKQAAQTRKRGQEMSVQLNTRSLVQSIVAHQTMTGELPEDVAALDSPGAFRDPWGNTLTFEYDEEGPATVVVISSAGPDGRFGTEDDLVERERLPM